MCLEFVIRHWDYEIKNQHEYWKSILFKNVGPASQAHVRSTVSAEDAAFLAQWGTSMSFCHTPGLSSTATADRLWNFTSPLRAHNRTRPRAPQAGSRGAREYTPFAPSRSPPPSPSPFLLYVSRAPLPARANEPPPPLHYMESTSSCKELSLALPTGCYGALNDMAFSTTRKNPALAPLPGTTSWHEIRLEGQ